MGRRPKNATQFAEAHLTAQVSSRFRPVTVQPYLWKRNSSLQTQTLFRVLFVRVVMAAFKLGVSAVLGCAGR